MRSKTYILLYGITVLSCLNFALASFFPSESNRQQYYAPAWEEIYTTGDFDHLQIWKIYRLPSGDDPKCISTDDFERSGRTYRFHNLICSEFAGYTEYTVVFNEISNVR